ncbi:MAG: hypothetical protein A3H31_10810 [Gallionellales bacterium RIFCSPLOWO2_02_FULL_57_47]|nr:MAG: hypothetical protein A3H31_10810 [Gallionellales bacterium RIFCSPLOWO2_02_FULL_57_47]OGT16459.1 MAG: hypothetical protein A3J49_18225 [Gallionellales bacterium RIFCSPHIGHO2_02_FULL_57_16]
MRTMAACMAVLLWGMGFAPNATAEENKSPQSPLTAKLDHTIGVCQLIDNPPIPPGTAANAMNPIVAVWGYLQTVEKLTSAQLTDKMFITAKSTLLQGAVHGTLEYLGEGYFVYHPTLDYLGADHSTVLVKIGGLKVKVVYHFKMISGGRDEKDGPGSYEDKKNCPNGAMWKISTINRNQ